MRLIDENKVLDKVTTYDTNCEKSMELMFSAAQIKQKVVDIIFGIEPVVEFDGPIEEVYVKGEKYEKVVRCKDCKHRDLENKRCDYGHNILWQLPRDDDWYCGDGERKDHEAD